MEAGRSKRRPERRRLRLAHVALAALIAAVAALPPPAAWAQAGDDVELTVRLGAIVSSDEAPSGDVIIEFSDASTREPVASYVVEASTEEQGFVVAVPLLESRSGWFVRARSPGWWGPTAYVDPDARDVELTFVPEGVVRFVVDGTDTGVDLLRTGQVWIAGRVGNRGVRLDRGVYGGPCEVDREPDRRDVLIFCPFARDETVDLRVRLGPFLPLLESDVTIAADLDLGLVEPVRGAVVTGSLPSGDGSSHRFGLLQPDTWSFAWSAWTDSGGFFAFEGLSPGAYELRLAGSDGDGWPVRIEALTDQIDLGQLVSAAANVLAVSFLVPSGVDLDDIRPEVWEATLGPDGAVEDRGRRFEFEERGRDGSFLWRGLPTGDYEVGVEDNRGNRWHHEVIRFFGQDHHYIELDAVPLVGRIELGGEPLENVMVWFGGMYGFERVSFRSREEGRFSGFLPREGYWPVEVTPPPDCDPCDGSWDGDGWGDFDSSEISGGGFFEIEADSDGIARIEIALSAAALSGRVVRRNRESSQLEPVAGARVWVRAVSELAGERHDSRLPESWRRRTDASGTFEVTGLPEWRYSVHAEAWVDERELQSVPLRIEVVGDDRIEDLELRLVDQRLVTVVVRSGGVPLAGAQTFVLYPAGSGLARGNSYTRGAGTASHYLPSDVEVVDVVVRAEGVGMKGWSYDVSDGAAIEIDLLADRGSLRVPKWQGGPGPEESLFFRDARLYTPGGAAIRIGTLAAVNDRGQIQEDGDEAIVRDLAPGTYRYCPRDDVCTRVDILPWAEARVRE